MRFWMSHDYASAINRREIPNGIYNQDVRVEYSDFPKESWHDTVGYTDDPNSPNPIQNLGGANGSYPIKAGEKLRYLFTPLALIQGSSYAKVKQDLALVLNFYKNHLSKIIQLLKQEPGNETVRILIARLALRRAFPITERFQTVRELVSRAKVAISEDLQIQIEQQLNTQYDADELAPRITKIAKYLPHYQPQMTLIANELNITKQNEQAREQRAVNFLKENFFRRSYDKFGSDDSTPIDSQKGPIVTSR